MERLTLKDHFRETQLFTGRVVSGGAFVLLLVAVLIARLVYLQVLSHDHYTTLSRNNRVTILPVPPIRGLIYDRNGVVMAQNLPSFSLEVVPEKVKDLKATIAALKKVITIDDEDVARFEKLRKQTSSFKAVPLRFRLNEEEVARFAVRRYHFPGVDIAARLVRHYPLGRLGVHAVGYVGRINEQELKDLDEAGYRGTTHIGKTGIEKFYEDTLHGQVGVKQVETNAQGRVLRVLDQTPPVPGKNIYLNLDTKVQSVAEHALNGQRGAVVAIEPQTGGVLAMVSVPGFDPNPFVNGIDSAEYSALATSKDQPLFNRAIRGRYPPGSTVKPFIGLVGLESGITTTTQQVNCPGWYSLKNDEHRYRDWRHGGHGVTNLRDAIQESCDVYFYDLALNLGIDRISSFMSLFGFGNRTGIDIRGEVSGLMPSRDWKYRVKKEPWYPGETLITGIGQGFTLSSPLQLAAATATLANYGLRVQPHIAFAEQEQGNGRMEYMEPVVKGLVPITEKANWDFIVEAMSRVVQNPRGTAHHIGIGAPYPIAGKTGTAQVFGIKQDEEYVKEDVDLRLRDHALFIAFAPVDNPRIAVAVIVENGGGGGSVAAPIARKVMDQFLLNKPL